MSVDPSYMEIHVYQAESKVGGSWRCDAIYAASNFEKKTTVCLANYCNSPTSAYEMAIKNLLSRALLASNFCQGLSEQIMCLRGV